MMFSQTLIHLRKCAIKEAYAGRQEKIHARLQYVLFPFCQCTLQHNLLWDFFKMTTLFSSLIAHVLTCINAGLNIRKVFLIMYNASLKMFCHLYSDHVI